MKKKKTILVIAVLLIFGAWFIFKYRSQAISASPQAIFVKASKVSESVLPLEARAIGTLVARNVEITPEVAGHVREIFFKDGETVANGAPLIQLDDAVYKTKHDLAQAKLTYSEMNFKRTQSLEKKGVLAKQALEQADADLKEKRADAKEMAVMLSKMKLLAPFAGSVGKRKIHSGDYVTVGQSLVTLTDRMHLHVEYNMPERQLASLKIGQTVKVSSSAYPGKYFYGKVAFISPTVTTDNRSVMLYAEVVNNENLLSPGMFVTVTQSLGNEEKAMMIPARSLVPMLNGEQVYKIVDGKAFAVNVLVGKRSKEQVQILQGLHLGDLIITDGQLKVKNGMPVQTKT